MASIFPAPATGGAGVTVSGAEPASPSEGDMWFDTATNTMKVYASGAFQATTPTPDSHSDWSLSH